MVLFGERDTDWGMTISRSVFDTLAIATRRNDRLEQGDLSRAADPISCFDPAHNFYLFEPIRLDGEAVGARPLVVSFAWRGHRTEPRKTAK